MPTAWDRFREANHHTLLQVAQIHGWAATEEAFHGSRKWHTGQRSKGFIALLGSGDMDAQRLHNAAIEAS